MPSTYTYPGVYVEEIPSGVRTIAGVSTSNTAFVGYFPRGPHNEARRVASFAEFERLYGGLDPHSEASYGVYQYFLNGGAVAFVVRVTSDADSADRVLQGGSGSDLEDTLRVTAASPGTWGNTVQVAVDHNVAAVYAGTRFNLVVREISLVDGETVVVQLEVFRNLSMDALSPRYVEDVINDESVLIDVESIGAGQMPIADGLDVIENPGEDAFQSLGEGAGNTPGTDGTLPTADGWITGEGATALTGTELARSGLYALLDIKPAVFNILCLPGAAALNEGGQQAVYAAAATFCEQERAFLLCDIPSDNNTVAEATGWMSSAVNPGTRNGAVYFPRLDVPDRLNENRPRNVASSGTMAGIYARTDTTRGVWKAPAGTDATLRGASLPMILSDGDSGALNPRAVNALRAFPVFGRVAWGARTLRGDDQLADEYKYIPVRRLALYIEESLYQGLQWVVFEPNDEPLWSQIRLNVGAFMQSLFRQGAFQGTAPRDAYFVSCDSTTTTQNDIDRGIVNIVVGFAPLKPAEFVVLKIQQKAGQDAS